MKKLFLAALLASSVLGPAVAADVAPAWLRVGPHTIYDGVTDDLVTGGLGAEAMLGAPPGYADPLHPTAAELRRAAHSKQNPEARWGENVLQAIRFAFFQLGQRDPGFTRANTLVIATGSSNGGGGGPLRGGEGRGERRPVDRRRRRARASGSEPFRRPGRRRARKERAARQRTHAARLLQLRQFVSALRSARSARHPASGTRRVRRQSLRVAARQGPSGRGYDRGSGEQVASSHARVWLGFRDRRRPRLWLFCRSRRDRNKICERSRTFRRARPNLRIQLRGRRQGWQTDGGVLFDLGLGQRVEVGEDLGPGRPWRGFAHRGDAVLQFLFQHQGEEAAGDVAADGLVEFVINRPRFEQALRCAERPLDIPLTLPLII